MASPSIPYHVSREYNNSNNINFDQKHDLLNLQSEHEYLKKILLYVRWRNQEQRDNIVLHTELRELKNKCANEETDNMILKQEVLKYKEKLNVLEEKFIKSFQVHQTLKDNLQFLSLSNTNLKKEIHQINYDGIMNLSDLEKETRKVRSRNKNLQIEIDRFSKIFSQYTTENNRLRAEIKDAREKIEALNKNLQQRNISDFSKNRFIVENVRPESESARNDFLQLPRDQNDYKFKQQNADLIKNLAGSVECQICLQKLHDENVSDDPIAVTPCGHRFHHYCIVDAINAQNINQISPVCPSCRAPISKERLVYQTEWNNMKRLYSCFHVKIQ